MTITDQHLLIERSGLLARTVVPRLAVSLGDVVGFHSKPPSLLATGWIQLCGRASPGSRARRRTE
ncbi:hypothetical protein [Prescottella agglutinans]|uniref:hypothetical protein n=1 Tax=Prescottella agglutinans TaxID=1644129 RepID=UPI002476282D|nr:hypothetical protein [Prescottella agglutinans]